MSKTIDSRVVEMRFDNAQFESNVRTSMSTLERLKQSLNLTKSAKGLEAVSAAAKKVDLSGMTSGIDTVNAKFSYLQMSIQHQLNRIVDNCVNAGLRMTKALTIEPVMTGLKEYETQINAVQTILANTQKEGTNVEIVNRALDELNTYADKTIYNFTEMTNNIGKFTAAGVKLDTSVNAIKGIANLAAVSGSTSQQASVAMYQLSQALAAGKVQLMDWNSVVNAGMGGQVFQDALIRTSENLKTGAKEAINTYGSFRESLTKSGWLTTEVLTETLNQLAGVYSKSELMAQGYTESQAEEIVKLADTAIAAATEVKTFTQLWDVMKEAAQSGWAQTWRLIIGDFEEAKALLTPLADFFTGDNGIITKMNDARNSLLEGALGKGFSGLGEKINNILEPAKKAAETVTEVTDTIADLGGIVDDVILGKFGDGQARFDALTKAGKNYYEVQNKVNEKLGNSKRYTQEQIDAQNKLLGVQKQSTTTTKETASAATELTKEQKNQIKSLAKLSDEQLRSKGYTEEQIAAFQELRDTAKQLGLSVDDLIDNMDEINGRWLLLNSFKNIGKSLITVFESIGEAWGNVFEPLQSDQLFNGIAAFHRVTANALKTIEANADNLTDTFQGLFSAIHLITTIAGGGFKLAFTVLSEILSRFDMNILDLTAGLGRAITAVDKFITENEYVGKAFDVIAEAIKTVIEVVDQFVESVVNSEPVQNFVDGIKEAFETIKEIIGGLFGGKDQEVEGLAGSLDKLKGSFDISGDSASNFKSIMDGITSAFNLSNYWITGTLLSGLRILDAVFQLFGTNLGDVAAKIADYIVKLRDWAKENTIFYDAINKVAKVIAEFIRGIEQVANAFLQLEPVQEIIQNFKDTITDLFGSFGEGTNLSFIDAIVTQIQNAFSGITQWVQSLSSSENLGRDIVLGLANGIKAGIAMAVDAITSVAKAVIDTFCSLLGIHSPSTVAFEWGKNIVEGLVNGIKSLVGMVATVIGALVQMIVDGFNKVDFESIGDGIISGIKKFIDIVKGFDFKNLLAIIPVGVVLLLVKKIYDVTKILSDGISNLNDVIEGFASIEKAFAGVLTSFSKNLKAQALQKIAVSLLILVGAVIALTLVDPDKLYSAVAVIGVLAGILVALSFAMDKMNSASAKIGKDGVNFDGLKSGLISIGVALLLLAVTVRLMGTMNTEEATQGFIGLAGLVAAVAAVFLAFGVLSKFNATGDIDKVGGMLIKLSVAMLLMVAVCKLAGGLNEEEMIKGAGFAAAFTVFVTLLSLASKLAGEHADKIGGMVLKLSVAMLLLVGFCKLVGQLETSEMLKGAAFAAGFTVFVAALVLVSKMFPQAQIQRISGLVLSISVSLLLMVGLCKLIGLLTPGDMLKGAAFVAGFIVLIGLLVKVTTIGSDQQIAKVSATILAMSIAIGLMAGVAILLGLMPLDALAKGVVAVGLLGLVMAAMIKATRGAVDIKGNLIVMTVAIATMAGAIALLSLIEPGKLAGATAAISIVMVIFSTLIKSATYTKGAIGVLAVMTVAVGMLGVLIYLLAGLPVENVIGSAAALGGLMLAMTTVLAILTAIGKKASSALGGVLALTALAVPLLVFVGILALLQNIEVATGNVATLVALTAALILLLIPLTVIGRFVGPALAGVLALTAMAVPLLAFIYVMARASNVEIATTNVIALGALTAALTAMLIPLTIIGAFVWAALAGVLALTAMAIPLLVFVGILARMSGVENAITNSMVLSQLMTTFGDVLFKIALVAPLALMGVAAMTGLVALIGAIGVFAIAVGALMDKFPGLQDFLNTGLPVLEQVCLSIGTMVGNIVAGFASSIMTILPQFGASLSAFMAGAMPFIAGAKSIDPSVLEGVGYLAGAIAALTAANLISGIGQFLSFGQSFSDLGTQLSSFITNAQPFLSGIKNIDPTAIESANTLAELILTLTKAELLSGISSLVSWFTGGNSFEDFGTQLASFGSAMKGFSDSISGISLDEGAINTVVTAGTKLAELQSSLEPMGGVVQWFTGERDFAAFGDGIVEFGNAMKNFSTAIAGITLDEASVSTVISAGSKLAELQSSLEKMGGVVQWFTGERDFAAFGEGIVAFGNAMKGFSESITGIVLDETALTTVISAATKLSELQSSLENMGGVISWFTGEKDFVTFGTQIQAFGKAMSSFGTSVGEGFNEEAVTSVINAGRKLSELQAALPEEGWFDGKMDLTTFSTYITSFGKAMGSFGTSVGEINMEAIDSSISAANRIKTLITSLAGLDASGVESFAGVGFGDGHIVNIAQAIAKYSEEVAGIDTEVVSSSITAANRLKSFIIGLAGMDPSGIENFKVSSIGSAIKGYAEKVAEIDTGVVSSSITAANRLKSFIAGLAGLDPSGITNFKVSSIGSQMQSYATSMAGLEFGVVFSSISAAERLKTFIAGLAGLDSSGIANFRVGAIGSTLQSYSLSVAGFNAGAVYASISAATSLKNFISSLAGFNSSGVGAFKAAIDQLATVDLNKVVSAFSGAGPRLAAAAQSMMTGLANGIRSSQGIITGAADNILNTLQAAMRSRASMFNSIGKQLMTQFINGIKGMSPQVRTAVTLSLSSAASSIRNYYSSFYSAGSYLGSGLVLGIQSKQEAAYDAGYALGQAAVRGEKDGQASNSPSKLTIQAGKWLGEGLVIGIEKMGTKVYNAGHNLGDSAAKSMSNSIAKVSDVINSDIDAQPTIRPVLDLEDIRAGAGLIDNMLDRTASVGVDANLSAINSMMNQNGVRNEMDEVVSAINKLRKDIGNMSTTVNNINGVTYDDGSSIVEAVEMLIRAAKMERRM